MKCLFARIRLVALWKAKKKKKKKKKNQEEIGYHFKHSTQLLEEL